VTADAIETVPVAHLAVGDLVLVRPGGRVPADGTVVDGAADVDASMITGESRPVPTTNGDQVVAGTVIAGGSLRVRVDAVGEATALAGIVRLVAAAQASASRAQALADRAAALLREAARRLRAAAGDCFVARVGGDEHAGARLAHENPCRACVEHVLHRIQNSCTRPRQVPAGRRRQRVGCRFQRD